MTGRAQRVMLALVVGLAAAGLLLILTQSRLSRLTSDFTITYSAGMLVREGDLAGPYDKGKLAGMMHRVAPDAAIDPRLPFSLPLAATLPFVALSVLPIDVAFRVWQLISAALLAAAVLLLQRALPLDRRAPVLAGLGLLAALPTWAALTEGQVSAALVLGAAMVIGGLRWDHPALAAGAGLLLAIKPQYLPPYLVVLYAGRRTRALAAAASGAAVLLLSPLVGGGISGIFAMIHNALSANQAVPLHLDETWAGVVAPALPAAATTGVAVGLYAMGLLCLVLTAWRRPWSAVGFSGLAASLAVLLSPHALPHDLVLLLIPAWIAAALYREGAIPAPYAGLLIVDLALLVDQRGAGLPVGPIVITAVLGWYGLRFRQRAQQAHRPPAARVA